MQLIDFNCTIQELKPICYFVAVLIALFQLHHTGIKTDPHIIRYCFIDYFNCTIQELKQ